MRFPAIRQVTWAVLILASASIAAQDAPSWGKFLRGSDIPFPEATWNLFTIVADSKGDDSALVQELPARLALDDKRHRALIALMKSAVDESDSYSASLRKAMCKARTKYTSPEHLDPELTLIDTQVSLHREKLMNGASPILGADGAARLEPVVVEVRDGMTLPRVDYLQSMRERKETPAAVLTRLCAEFNN